MMKFIQALTADIFGSGGHQAIFCTSSRPKSIQKHKAGDMVLLLLLERREEARRKKYTGKRGPGFDSDYNQGLC
jgi:hypothetical protein